MARDFYWHASQLAEDGVMPGVLAIGDSWFWYPFPGGALLHHLAPYMRKKERIVFAVGHNGAEAIDYVDGVYREEVAQALKLYGDGLTEVLILAAGVSLVKLGQLATLVIGPALVALMAFLALRLAAQRLLPPERAWPMVGLGT